MNDYFDFLDFDSQIIPVYPNDNMYKQPSMKPNTNFNNNTLNNMININNNCGLLDATEGLLRGNMFPDLYVPYKYDSTKMRMQMNEREKKLFDVQKLCFAMKDINLYLDIHPEDTCMIKLYNKYLKEYTKALKNYEEQYGPVTIESESLDSMPWAWSTQNFPWEVNK